MRGKLTLAGRFGIQLAFGMAAMGSLRFQDLSRGSGMQILSPRRVLLSLVWAGPNRSILR